MRPRDIKSSGDVTILGSEILGIDPALTTGCVQPMATWLDPEGARVALRICDATPRSETDFFLLNLARARADAILTTGNILREEPNVTHTLQGPGSVPEALADWRRNVLGLRDPPWLLVLTSGRSLDPDHPAFKTSVRPVLFVPEDAAPGLTERFGGMAQVEGVARTGAREAVDWLRENGAERITIEAGPSASASLYDEPIVIDEIWRSTYQEHELLRDVIGPTLRPDRTLDALLPSRTGGVIIREPSGPWLFERLSVASN
jgi:riboflavin biosynthesis pyrimidine reductase